MRACQRRNTRHAFTSPKPKPAFTTTSRSGLASAVCGIESIACVLMLSGGFVHPSINCEDVHPAIEEHADSIPHTVLAKPDLDVVVKAGFGFGDVNACLVFRRYARN